MVDAPRTSHDLARDAGRVALFALLWACAPDTTATTGGSSSTGSSGVADASGPTTGPAPPTSTSASSSSSSTGATTGAPPGSTTSSESSTTSTTDTTDTTDATTHGVQSSTGGSSTTSDSTDSTGGVCPAGTPLCIDDEIKYCDGLGGFEVLEPDEKFPCEYGCLDGSSCKSCAQVVAEVDCPIGLPRVMVLLDASSSMLNDDDAHAPQGMGSWNQARDALAGANSIFDLDLDLGPVQESVLVGLAVFGHDTPGEAALVVSYGACHKENVRWALDPGSSCGPGCDDPYGPPPIAWTFEDGALIDPPGFADKTLSHVPKCDADPKLPLACAGSGTYTHLGLERVRTALFAHRAHCAQLALPCTDQTQFINILITDGSYDSTDADVQAPLAAMFAAGVPTHVIGFADDVDPAQLAMMAAWGSGGALDPHLAANQDQLETALLKIMETLDPC